MQDFDVFSSMSGKPPVHIIWFKRDLRAVDHAVLAWAMQSARADGAMALPLYAVEPEWWRQPDAAYRHWATVQEGLIDLRTALARQHQTLFVRTGAVTGILEDLRGRYAIAGLWSHEETGNRWTFERDKAVGRWCRAHGISWTELPQTGVIRRLRDRNGWARKWERSMAKPIAVLPARLPPPPGIDPGEIPDQPPGVGGSGWVADDCPARQAGGRMAGWDTLHSFLAGRGQTYHKQMSSPVTAYDSCSRLSTHLAWGTLSMREIVQATRARGREIGALPDSDLSPEERADWNRALNAFDGRLHWRCHFMQKLESEPALEFRCLHPGYEGLRTEGADPEALTAWAAGRTGYPFVDACMRALRETGWINFRMRAMLTSFASYHLWLHWRDSGLVLARLFSDYEPGIHWSQAQMQSGTTGINTVRIYNPLKQSTDQDADGRFIRQWVPELADVPGKMVHWPWKMTDLEQEEAGCRIGRDYPPPIVDQAPAARTAKAKVHGVRRARDFAVAADAIQEKHGSRRSGLPRTRGRRDARAAKNKAASERQFTLDI